MTDTFTWRATYGASAPRKPKVRENTFGDGYVQSTKNGIANNLASWDLSFNNLDPATALAIDTFLGIQGGAEPFFWTDPDGVTLKYVCKEWSRSFEDEDTQAIRAKFEQRL